VILPAKAVIFDRDGVLTDFDLAAAASYFRPLVPLSVKEMASCWEMWGRKVGFPRSAAEEKEFFYGFWEAMGDQFNLDRTTRTRLHQFDYTTCVHPYPEARTALLEARRRSLHVGVLSNFSLASLGASLEAAGLADLIDVACAATVIGAAKPAPEAYLSVTQALGVEPEECLFFDDEWPCVEGAAKLGVQAYLVDRQRVQHALTEKVVCDLNALPTILSFSQVEKRSF
jgi:HAD superfamily hydrolase (TIGR01509 family)